MQRCSTHRVINTLMPCYLRPAEEVLLDENAEAKRYKFYMVAGFEESPDHK